MHSLEEEKAHLQQHRASFVGYQVPLKEDKEVLHQLLTPWRLLQLPSAFITHYSIGLPQLCKELSNHSFQYLQHFLLVGFNPMSYHSRVVSLEGFRVREIRLCLMSEG